jgi:hypothetical protein
MLSLGIKDIIGKQFQRPQNGNDSPKEVWIFVSEEVDLLNNLSMSMHYHF